MAMPVYTVHTRQAPLAPGDGGKVVFVPDVFSRWAFIAGPLWFVWARAWLGLALWLAAFAALAGVAFWLQPPPRVVEALALIGALLTGLEANNLRRAALERRGMRCADVVTGGTIEEAERAFFRRAAQPDTAPGQPPGIAARPGGGMVGGLFPDWEG